jgi:hypothetical protein
MTQLIEPFTSPPAPEAAPRRLSGTRRAIASVLLTAGLLAVGGTAVALAADPSVSPAPSTSTQPSSGGTGAPSTGTPSTGDPAGRGSHANGKDCPNLGGSTGSGGSGGQQGSPATPTTPTTPDVSASPSV